MEETSNVTSFETSAEIARKVQAAGEGAVEVAQEIAIAQTIREIQEVWEKGTDQRMELGKLFSELRERTKPYKKDETGLSYTASVRKTGVPRGTAELYRGMYEVCSVYNVPSTNFLLLAEAGLNLKVLRDAKLGQTTVDGVLADHPELRQSDREKINFRKIADRYSSSSESLPAEIAKISEIIKKLEADSGLADVLKEKKKQLRDKQQQALRNFATVLTPFLGWSDDQLERYLKKMQDETFEVGTKYADALTFMGQVFSAGDETVK